MRPFGLSTLWIAGLLSLSGCDNGKSTPQQAEMDDGAGGSGEGSSPDSGVQGDPTWYQDVKPLLDAHCTTCHRVGGAGPFRLDTYADAKRMAVTAMDAIENERMPPWKASRDCRELQDVRFMPPEDRATLARWIGADMPEGIPSEQAAQEVEWAEPDLVGISPAAYLPSDAAADDYRCLVLDLDFDADTYVVGTNVIPDQGPIVHHVLVYVVSPNERADIEALDAADPGPGYTCFGTPGTEGVPSPIAAWVPGMPPQLLDDDSMFFIPSGSKLVMQVHYNVLSAPPALDQTTLHLFTTDVPRAFVHEALPQVQLEMTIPAGDPAVEIVKLFPFRSDTPGVAVAAAPHMHILGTAIKVELTRANGDTECVIDMPKWDFNWQQTYRFVEPLEVQKGDVFKLTCNFDNSAENQAVVDGERIEPRDVHWGDGTLDEMCLNFITYKRPFTATSGIQCGGFEMCRAGCEQPGSFECVMGCGARDMDCGICLIFDMLGTDGCAREQCLTQVLDARECLQDCMSETIAGGSDIISCMDATCPAQLAEVSGCMSPIIQAGECEPSVEACVP